MHSLTLTMNDTKFTLVPALEEEHQFCFSHDDPRVQQSCVGYLRGDFGSTDQLFYCSWFDQNSQLKTKVFQKEFDDIVTALRNNGLLSDRSTMNARCSRFPDALIKTQWRSEMAFRTETEHHTYFLRCIPGKGDYNFYLFGYNKAAFMEALRQRKGLPFVSWSVLKTTGEVIAIKYGESGYHKWDASGYEGIPSQEIVDYLNEVSGVSKAQAAAMEMGSMFGWHSPAADPRRYDECGRFLQDSQEKKKDGVER